MGLEDQCFLEKSTGTILKGQEWLDLGINAQALATSGNWTSVPCVLTKDPSNLTPEEQTQYHIFSPLLVPVEPITIEKMLLAIVVAKYMKTPDGMKQLSSIAEKYLDVVGKTMAALSAAGASHPLASLIHGRITIGVYETLGLIQPMQARILHSNFEDGINKIIAQKYLSDIIGGVAKII